MMAKEDIAAWLETLPPDTGVGVDDGGLTLVAANGAYLEVGGVEEPT